MLSAVLMSSGDEEIEQMHKIAAEIEERYPRYASVLRTRKHAVKSLTFCVEPASDSDSDIAIANEIEKIIRSPMFRRGIGDMLDAIGKGFSVLEIIWDTSSKPWKPQSLTWQPQWYFKFDQRVRRELLLKSEADALGVELPEQKFIIHKSTERSGPLYRAGIARIVAPYYLAMAYAMRDWSSFCETYGIPVRTGSYPLGATQEQKSALLRALREMGSSATAILPVSMKIETSEGVSGSHGSSVFGDFLKMIHDEVTILVLGQTMTTTDGSSQSQANVHDRVRNDILWADVQDLADTINEQFIAQYVALNYGDIAPPLLKISQDEKEDLSSLSSSIVPLIDRGLPVSAAQIAAKFDLLNPGDVTDPLGAQAQPQESQQQSAIAMNAKQKKDMIEARADKLASEWEPVMDPIISPILQAAKDSESFEDFSKRLDSVMSEPDMDKIAKALAYNQFAARVDASVTAQKVKKNAK